VTGARQTAMDIGTRVLRIASAEGVRPIPVYERSAAEAARVAASAVGGQGSLCAAVPDGWLSGDKAGAEQLEKVRHACEDVARTGQVRWIGQLAAVCAHAVAMLGPGRYLVCDVGASGVRAGVFSVVGTTMQVEGARAEAGGALPATWYEQAAAANRARACAALQAALTSGDAEDLDATVYRVPGPGDDIIVTAGVVIDAFEPTGRRLRAVISGAGGSTAADRIVVGGGLGWLPLVARAAATAVGAESADGESMPGQDITVAAPDAAARGALSVAGGEVTLKPPVGLEEVKMSVRRIRDGLLEEVSVTLPWSEPFASFPGGVLTVDSEELEVTVGGQPRVARLDGLVPGPYLVGLRPTWPGPGVLVVRPASGGRAPHVLPLADLARR